MNWHDRLSRIFTGRNAAVGHTSTSVGIERDDVAEALRFMAGNDDVVAYVRCMPKSVNTLSRSLSVSNREPRPHAAGQAVVWVDRAEAAKTSRRKVRVAIMAGWEPNARRKVRAAVQAWVDTVGQPESLAPHLHPKLTESHLCTDGNTVYHYEVDVL